MDNRGIALLVTLILLGTIIATALSISVLITGETKINRLVDDSVMAVYAADAGMEKMFYACSGDSAKITPPPDGQAAFTNNNIGNLASYTVCMATRINGVTSCNNSCNSAVVMSRGQFGATQRSFEADY